MTFLFIFRNPQLHRDDRYNKTPLFVLDVLLKGCFSGCVGWSIYFPCEWSGRMLKKKQHLSEDRLNSWCFKVQFCYKDGRKRQTAQKLSYKCFSELSWEQNNEKYEIKRGSLKHLLVAVALGSVSRRSVSPRSSTVNARPISMHPPSWADSLRRSKHRRRVSACLECSPAAVKTLRQSLAWGPACSNSAWVN